MFLIVSVQTLVRNKINWHLSKTDSNFKAFFSNPCSSVSIRGSLLYALPQKQARRKGGGGGILAKKISLYFQRLVLYWGFRPEVPETP
jgi:hypothetical protein